MVNGLDNNEAIFLGIAGGALSTTMLDELDMNIEALRDVPVLGSVVNEPANLVGVAGGAYLGNEVLKNVFDMGIGRPGTINKFWLTFSAASFFNMFASEMTETATGKVANVTNQVPSVGSAPNPAPKTNSTKRATQIVSSPAGSSSSRNSRGTTR